MSAALPLPAMRGDRILLRATDEHAYWRCLHVLTGSTTPCGRTGRCSLDTWRNNPDSEACTRCVVRERRIRSGSLPGRKRSEPTSATAAEYFRCAALDLKCSRQTCAASFAMFNPSAPGRSASACTRCEIGKAHAAGKGHPSAPAIPRPVPIVHLKPRNDRRCMAPSCRASLPIGKRNYCNNACRTEAYAVESYTSMALDIHARQR